MKKSFLLIPISFLLLAGCQKVPEKTETTLVDRGESEAYFQPKEKAEDKETVERSAPRTEDPEKEPEPEEEEEVREVTGEGEKSKKKAPEEEQTRGAVSPKALGSEDERVAQTTLQFMDALKKGDLATVTELMPKKERAKSRNNLEKTVQAFRHPFFRAILSKTGSKVVAVERDGNKAKVTLEMSAPSQKAMEEFMTEQMVGLSQDPKFQGLGQMEKLALLGEKLDKAELPVEKNTATADLVLEDGAWRIAKPPQGKAPGAGPKGPGN